MTTDWGEPLSGKTSSNVLFQPTWGMWGGARDNSLPSDNSSLPPPPGISKSSSGPPPGLGSGSNTNTAKEVPQTNRAQGSSNFLSYLNQNPTWKT